MSCEWCQTQGENSLGIEKKGPYIEQDRIVGVSNYLYTKYTNIKLCDHCDLRLECECVDFENAFSAVHEELKSKLSTITLSTQKKVTHEINLHSHLDKIISQYVVD